MKPANFPFKAEVKCFAYIQFVKFDQYSLNSVKLVLVGYAICVPQYAICTPQRSYRESVSSVIFKSNGVHSQRSVEKMS